MINFKHTLYSSGHSLTDLNKLAKDVDKSLCVSKSGPDYYLIKGTDPMNFVQLAHVKAFAPMSHDWAMETIAQILRDLKDA